MLIQAHPTQFVQGMLLHLKLKSKQIFGAEESAQSLVFFAQTLRWLGYEANQHFLVLLQWPCFYVNLNKGKKQNCSPFYMFKLTLILIYV